MFVIELKYEAELTEIDWRAPDGSAGIPAARGGDAVRAAWTALALLVAGRVFIRDAWTDLAGDTFGRLTRAQTPSGGWLLAGAPYYPACCDGRSRSCSHRTAAAAWCSIIGWSLTGGRPW